MQTRNEKEMIDKKEKQFVHNDPCKRNFQRTRRKKTKFTFNIRAERSNPLAVPRISGLLRRYAPRKDVLSAFWTGPSFCNVEFKKVHTSLK